MCNLLDCADRVFILQLVYKQNQIPSISTKMALKMPICILKNCALMLPSRSLQIGQIVHSVRMKSQCHGTWSNSQISPKNKHRPTLCFEDLFGIYEYSFFSGWEGWESYGQIKQAHLQRKCVHVYLYSFLTRVQAFFWDYWNANVTYSHCIGKFMLHVLRPSNFRN